MKYLGDLSRRDVQVLAEYAARADGIVEFGVGASTQVIAEHCPDRGWFHSIDTSEEWIKRTQENLRKLNIYRVPSFVTWERWLCLETLPADLAFDDGIDDLRCEFALRIWPKLKIGGVLLIHDTRHLEHIERTIVPLIHEFHSEIDAIRFNEQGSNIAAVVKKISEPYVNWNECEKIARGAFARFDGVAK